MKRFLTLFSMSVFLGATAQTSHLTFEDALLLAFEANPAVKATEYAERAAHRDRQAAIGLFMPKISIKGSYAHFNRDIKIDFNPMLTSFAPILGEGLAMLGLDLSYTLQRRNTAFLGGDIVLPIFAGGKIWTANKAAKLSEERVQSQGRQVRGGLIVEVVERYFGSEMARRAVAIYEEAVAVVGQHLRDVALLEKEGMAVASERLYAEYKLAETERDLQCARLQLETAQKALLTSLGSNYRVEPSTPMFLLPNIEPLAYFQTAAALHNPQIEEMSKVRELARMDLRLQRADYFPEIVAIGGAVFCDHQLSSLVPRMAVGIGLNFKIFDGLHREYKASSARLQLRRVQMLEQQAEQSISLLIEDQYNKVQSALMAVGAVERSLHFAEEYLRAKRNAMREGVATSTDVVDAALNLSRARLERVKTAYEFNVALARLLNTAGVGESFVSYMNSDSARSVF
jgi:outer membrane protein TolC